MMFLMMLLLLDDDNNTNTNNKNNIDQQQQQQQQHRLRRGYSSNDNNNNIFNPTTGDTITEKDSIRDIHEMVHHRIHQDHILQYNIQNHERYQFILQNKNNNIDYIKHIHDWCYNHINYVRDEFFITSSSTTTVTTEEEQPLNDHNGKNNNPNFLLEQNTRNIRGSSSTINSNKEMLLNTNNINNYNSFLDELYYDSMNDSNDDINNNNNNNNDNHHNNNKEENQKFIYHYPWNTTGFYRGSWTRILEPIEYNNNKSNIEYRYSDDDDNYRIQQRHQYDTDNTIIWSSTKEMERDMIDRLRHRYHDIAGILSFPSNIRTKQVVYQSMDHNINGSDTIYYYDASNKKNYNRTYNTNLASNEMDETFKNSNDRIQQQQQRIAGMNQVSSKDILSQGLLSFLNSNKNDNHNNHNNNNKPEQMTSDDKQRIQNSHPNEYDHVDYNSNNMNDKNQEYTGTTRRMNTNTDTISRNIVVPHITLTRNDGRAAFQLFGKSIYGMREMSLVSGFLKLYDSTANGYSTRKDVLLRVQGIYIHSIGRISLVANIPQESMVLVIDPHLSSNNNNASSSNLNNNPTTTRNRRDRHRRLQESVKSLVTSTTISNNNVQISEEELANIRNEALELHGSSTNNDGRKIDEPLQEKLIWNLNTFDEVSSSQLSDDLQKEYWNNQTELRNIISDFVIPYPFVHDDRIGSLRNSRIPNSKMMPIREQALEANAAGCKFDIVMDVTETETTIGTLKKLLLSRYIEMKRMETMYPPESMDPNENEQNIMNNNNNNRQRHVIRPYTSSSSSQSYRSSKYTPKEALVMNMVGTIHSYNCDFHAHINTTALRTDWDATTNKAINYSFYMMLVCLTQIFILLRQLLHSQSQSIAIRVSLICIGWQTIIDALLCLTHIYLSLAVQPLFTAFASVAFFKLLIFCVIEMKYMAIVLQARNNSSGRTLTSEALRQQVALLHVRFYVALVAVFLFVFYSPGKNRMYIILALYSFWVPQIVLNVITEAKTPLHKNYIYGMTVTRLIAPLYIFGLRNNFLKEVYPDSTTDTVMCQLLVLWVGFQTAILIAQGKYGARFMIPKRFLPPKFDYSRPIPASMLPPGVLLELPTSESMDDRANDSVQAKGSIKREERDIQNDTSRESDLQLRLLPLRHQTADTTRHRHHRGGGGGRGTNMNQHHLGLNNNNSSAMIKEEVSTLPKAVPTPAPVLECSICYDDIDIRDRFKYMLAPCNHLYHSECLKQWMEVKMECPICRTQLPAL
jgi:hypothetical protein